MHRLLLFPVFVLLVFQSMAQPGALDVTFNGTGIVEKTLFQNLANETIYASVLQPDGKLLVAGSQKLFTAEEGFVARLLANGQLDPTFANKGVFLTGSIKDIIGGLFVPKAIALDDLGGGVVEIVLAGYAINLEQVACVVKLKQNGTHVAGFGGSGFYATAPVFLQSAVFNTVQVHTATHAIIAAGTNAAGNVGGDYLVVSLSSAGVPNNITTEVLSTNSDEVFSSELVGDVIYLAGTSKEATAPFREFFSIVRMNVLTHAIDISSILPLGNTSNKCNVVKVATDGKIILAGRAFNGSTIETLVYRLSSTGVPDAGNFGPNGYVSYDLSPGFSESIFAMSLDPNNDIVLGGHVYVSGGAAWWKLCRISYTTGAIDPNFYLRTVPSPPVASSRGIASVHRLANGKYILVGETLSATNNSKTDGLFKRVNSDGSEDIQNPFWVSDANTVFTDMAVDGNGKIWACGNIEPSEISTKYEAFIARFNANGTLDQSFVDLNPETENGIKIIFGASGGTAVHALKILSNGNLLVAGSTMFSTDNDFFVARLNNQGEQDYSFSPAQGGIGYFRYNFEGGDDVACDLALQLDGSILVYGHAFNTVADANVYSLIRLKPNGDFDNTFRVSSTDNRYAYLNSYVTSQDFYMNVRVDANDRIVFGGTDDVSDDFFVVRLRSNGEDDPTFNAAAESPSVPGVLVFDVQGGSNDYLTCLVVKPNSNKILLGGNRDGNDGKKYVLIQVNENGTHDTNFGAAGDFGRVIVSREKSIEGFIGLHIEASSGAIVASGFSGNNQNSFEMTTHRFSSNGILDPTFGTEGSVAIMSGQPYGSAIVGNRLFVVGRQNRNASPYLGFVAKVKLGVGVVTINTNMVYNNINKTYGDVPFIMKPSSNSPAPYTYSIVSGSCATVDANTGKVTITCAGPENTVTIRASQAAVRGFTAATADATISIAKATPKIAFKNQGGVVGNTFTLQASSNSDAVPVYGQLNGDTFLTVDEYGSVSALLKGSATVVVSYSGTDNYLPATAVAEVYTFNKQVPPRAYDDQAKLIFGVETFAYIEALANDTGYTGQIVPVLTDLDPETPGIQSTFVSPSMGTFTVDNSGIVLFMPFQGFIGSGELSYTVKDDQGNISLPAKIMVSVSTLTESSIPALKVTEMFTPNGDGLNEAFVIGFINPEKSNQLKIFDRNGAELFSQRDYKNDWEGQLSNGTMLENGTYYYLFTEGSGGDQREVSGFIEIKK